jgi:RHS repeat-associated protein
LETFPLTDHLTAQVNLSNGNLAVHAVHSALSAPGVSVNVDSFYNSQSTGSGAFGPKTVMTTGRDVGLQVGASSATFTGPSGFTAVFTQNPDGSYTEPAGINADLVATGGTGYTLTYRSTGEQLSFSPGGFLTSDLTRDGVGNTFSYSSDNTVASIADSTGNTMNFVYTNGVITELDRAATVTDYYSYDSAGRLTGDGNDYQRVFGDSSTNVPVFAYDAAGNLTTITTPAGRTIGFGYDPSGRVTSVSRYTTQGQNSGDAAVTGFGYAPNPDGSGQATETNPAGQTSTFALDTLGRVTQVTDPLGHMRAQTYTPNSDVQTAVDAMGTGQTPSNTTRFAYDPTTNNLTSVTLPTGASTTLQYSGGAGCASTDTTHPYLPKCVTDPQGHQSAATYSASGDPLTSTDTTSGIAQTQTRQGAGADCGGKPGAVCTATDGKGAVTSYAYNSLGLLTQVSPPAPGVPTSYTYDSLNRLDTRTDPNGWVTTYQYDSNDYSHRVSQIANPDATYSNTNNNGASYFYDGDGNLTSQNSVNYAPGKTDTYYDSTYTYDALGRETVSDSGNDSYDSAAPHSLQNLVYDKVGNLTSFTDGQGAVSYGYDAGNELVSATEPGGDCTTTPGTGCTRFGYNNNGARTSTTYPGGTVQNTTVDNSGRPTRITATGPGANGPGTGTVFSDLGYGYTAGTSDRTVMQTRTNTVAEGAPNGSSTNYTYDSLNRLTTAAENLPGGGLNGAWSYAYDGAGNKTAQRVVVPGGQAFETGYSYSADNRLTSHTGTGAPIGYDNAGNQTSYPDTAALPGNMDAASPQTTTNYDTANHSYIQNSGGTPVTMTYLNPDQNQRITAGGTYYGTGVLGVSYQTTNAATTAFTRTPGGSLISERTSAGNVYYLTDNQGSVIGLVNNQGQKVAGYSYTPYGQTRTITGDLTQANNNPYRYTSGYLDPTSNLYKLGYRYYDPTQSRFTQQDPSGQETNAYAYAGDDPTDNVDPSGRNWVSDALDPWGVFSTSPVRQCAVWGAGAAATTALVAAPTGPVDPLIAGGTGAIGCASGAASALVH